MIRWKINKKKSEITVRYFSLIENPTDHDYRVIELANIITHHYKIKV